MTDYVHDQKLKWWQRPTWLASLAALIAAMSYFAFVFVTIRDSRTLDAIEHQQEDVDDLLCFVHVALKEEVDGEFRRLVRECIEDRQD